MDPILGAQPQSWPSRIIRKGGIRAATDQDCPMIYDLPVQKYPPFIHWSYFGSGGRHSQQFVGLGPGAGGLTTQLRDPRSLGLTDYGPQTSDWDRDWDRCGGVRSVPGVQVCGHNVPTIRTSVPHLKRGHPKGGDGWGQYSSRSPGRPLWSRWRPNPVHEFWVRYRSIRRKSCLP